MATGEVCRTSLHHRERIESIFGWSKGMGCLAVSFIGPTQGPRRPCVPAWEIG